MALLALDTRSGAWTPIGDGFGVEPTPDRRLVVASTTRGIVVSDAGGAGAHVVSDGAADLSPFAALLSPDGSQVAYAAHTSSSSDTNDNEIIVVGADGAGRHQLTNGAAVRLYVPDGRKLAWSPDGTKLAFVSAGAPNGGDAIVAIAEVGDGSVKRLTDAAAGGFNDLWWTPDGQGLVASSMNGGIVHVNAESGAVTRLNPGDEHASSPALSPDGQTIAYLGGRGELMLVPAAGGPTVDLGIQASSGARPAWSHDGGAVLCATDHAVEYVRVADRHVTELAQLDNINFVAW